MAVSAVAPTDQGLAVAIGGRDGRALWTKVLNATDSFQARGPVSGAGAICSRVEQSQTAHISMEVLVLMVKAAIHRWCARQTAW